MRVLGIDPGLATIGFGVLDSDCRGNARAVAHGVILTPKDEALPTRLAMIEEDLKKLIQKYKPQEIALEELFFNNNQKTAINVAHGRGGILLAGKKSGVPTYEYTPLQIKQALTGYGRAEKKQIQEMVKTMLGLKAIPKPDDAADAVAVALTHVWTNRMAGAFGIK